MQNVWGLNVVVCHKNLEIPLPFFPAYIKNLFQLKKMIFQYLLIKTFVFH